MAEPNRPYPLPVYNYKVEIGGKDIAFSEASGLDITYGTTVYKESPGDGELKDQAGPKVMIMPGQGTPAELTLKKGVVVQETLDDLFDWINSIKAHTVEKKDIKIRLCDEHGTPVIEWHLRKAFPTKLEAPTFAADSNDVAIESMSLIADGVEIKRA